MSYTAKGLISRSCGHDPSLNPSVQSAKKVTYLQNGGGVNLPPIRLLLILTQRLNRFSCGLKHSTQKSIQD